MKFRLSTILWVFALLASAMATFGDDGLIPALVILFFWALVFFVGRISVFEWLVTFAIVLVTIALLFPAVQGSRAFSFCLNNMRQVGLALLFYENIHGTLPPAYFIDGNGRTLHSWRHTILPHIEMTNLYNRIRKGEPWDSPYNKPLTDLPLDWMQCPSNPASSASDNMTNYFAVVGPQTAWPGKRGLKLAEIKDDPDQTILLIEAGGKKIAWAEPKDLCFEEAVDLLTQPANPEIGDGHWVENGFFYQPSGCRHVLFASEYSYTLRGPLSKKMAKALLTIDGGEDIDMNELDYQQQPDLNYSRIYSLSVFVLLSLLPITKLWRNKLQSRNGSDEFGKDSP